MALTQTLTDNFPGPSLSANWGSYGTTAVIPGRLAAEATTGESGIFSATGYTLTGSYLLAKVIPYTAAPGAYAYLQGAVSGGDGGAGIQYNTGTLFAYWISSTGAVNTLSSITYDPVAHAWWRIRESGGTTFYDTAPDGATWTNQWSVADPAGVSYSALLAQFGAGISSGTPGNAYIADFNVAGPSRSQFTWPFSYDSIWNMPVAPTATYTPSGITVTSDYSTDPTAVEYDCTDPGQPVKSLTNAMLAGGGIGAASVYVNPAMSALGQFNDCAAFLGSSDNDTVYQGQTLQLTAGANPDFGGTGDFPVATVSITGTGITGAHGGSGLSALGGTLTVADLTGTGPITHAMKVCFNGFLYYSSAGTGFQWPAVSADGGFNNPSDPNFYGGSNPHVVMGTLLALPPFISPSKYADPLVQRIATAMQCYGAYIVDNTASGPGVSDSLIELNYDAAPFFTGTGTFSSDFHQLLMDIQVVTNSASGTPGGGSIGSERFAPYAPVLEDGSGAPPAVTVVSPGSLPSEAAAVLSGTGSLTAGGTVTAPDFTAVAAPSSSTSHTFTLTPHAVGNFFLVGVISETAADFATALSSSNITWSSPLVGHTSFTHNAVVETIFIGVATSTSSATVTITFTAGSPTTRTAWQEFRSSLGYSAVTLDTSGTVDVASSGSFPSLTPAHGAGELYWGYLFDSGTGTAGSTAGFSYFIDPNGNPVTYNANCTNAAQHPNIGDTTDAVSGIAVLLYQAITLLSGGAALSGTGALAAGALVAQHGSAALSGTGTLTSGAKLAVPASAVLLGTGSLSASAGVTAPGGGSAALSGTGTLTVSGTVTFTSAAALSGTGSLTSVRTGTMEQSAALAGTGTLTVAAKATLRFTAGLFGGGFLSIPQVAGGLVNGVGGAGTPMALPGSSQVAVAPPGSSNWQWLGTLGQVTALTYSYVCPGGCDKMSMTLMVPASYRTQLFNPGWQVKITRGGHQVWDGKLDEPQPSASGWTLTAVGTGNRGTDFTNFYAPGDVWPAGEPDEIINRAIGRGLPWVNPGYNSSPLFSQFWMGQATDPGSSTVTAFLNLICTRGGLTWYVNSQPGGSYGGDDLNIFPLPTVPTRLLVATTPVARTLGGYVNSLVIRYQSTADDTTASPPVSASYNVVAAINQQSVAAHGTLEAYLDLSDVGVQTATQAQAVGNQILSIYEAASFAGPFTVSYGQLLNMGGQAVDIGTDQAGGMVKLVLTDYAYGGSVTPNNPVTFIVGSYQYDDFKQTATIQPYQTLNESLSGMLSAFTTTNTPITVAST